jgi:hypothetical protein
MLDDRVLVDVWLQWLEERLVLLCTDRLQPHKDADSLDH